MDKTAGHDKKFRWLIPGYHNFIPAVAAAIFLIGAIASPAARTPPSASTQKKPAEKSSPGAPAAIQIIGHAHIDPVWRWTKDEGHAEVLATFRSAVARLKEYPDAAFVASSAQFYQWVKEADPVLFSEIKALVKQGRWNPVGGWWVEADTNCPHGESLVRQGLYGQRFFKENFGAATRIGFNPDVFGHPWTLPQILAGQGLESYFFMRPGPHEKTDLRTPLFQWRGPDGTGVLGVQILGSYNATEDSIAGQIRQTEDYFSQNEPGAKAAVVFFGVGDHGGGPTSTASRSRIRKSERPASKCRAASASSSRTNSLRSAMRSTGWFSEAPGLRFARAERKWRERRW